MENIEVMHFKSCPRHARSAPKLFHSLQKRQSAGTGKSVELGETLLAVHFGLFEKLVVG